MTRIFLTLSLVSLGLFVLTMCLGWAIGDLRDVEATDAQAIFRLHFLLGVMSALGVVLVNSIAVTYFIGTSRWCREVVETYGLDARFIQSSAGLKRSAFPLALVSMLTVVGVAALGAASDPATALGDDTNYAMLHLLAAITGLAICTLAFYLQGRKIEANHGVIEQVMAEVRRIRVERGLDPPEGDASKATDAPGDREAIVRE